MDIDWSNWSKVELIGVIIIFFLWWIKNGVVEVMIRIGKVGDDVQNAIWDLRKQGIIRDDHIDLGDQGFLYNNEKENDKS